MLVVTSDVFTKQSAFTSDNQTVCEVQYCLVLYIKVSRGKQKCLRVKKISARLVIVYTYLPATATEGSGHSVDLYRHHLAPRRERDYTQVRLLRWLLLEGGREGEIQQNK